MSVYQVQKLMREVNRDPAARDRFRADPAAVAAGYDLSEDERRAVLAGDWGTLYRMGVHGLILRPFSNISGVSERDYLDALQ